MFILEVASSAPTSSLNQGDLYFDTTSNELKVYKSSGWAAAGSTVNGTSTDLNLQQLLVKQHLLAMMTIQIIWLSMLHLLMSI